MNAECKKIFIGCGLAVGALVLLLLGSCVAFVVWLKQPGELLEPQQLLGADTTGYVEWSLSLDDPGTAAMAEAALEAIQKQRHAVGEVMPFPAGLTKMLMGWQNTRDEQQLKRLFPAVAAWTLRAGANSEDGLHTFSLSIRSAGHQIVLVDWGMGLVLGRAAPELRIRYRGENIYRLEDKHKGRVQVSGVRLPRTDREPGSGFEGPVFVFLNRRGIFLSFDERSARLAVDRLAEPQASPRASTELERLLNSVAEAPLRGALVPRHGELRSWLEDGQVATELLETVDEVRWITVHGAFENGHDFALTLELQVPEARHPVIETFLLREIFGELLAVERPGSNPEAGVETEISSYSAGDRLVVSWKVIDLPQQIENWQEESTRELLKQMEGTRWRSTPQDEVEVERPAVPVGEEAVN